MWSIIVSNYEMCIKTQALIVIAIVIILGVEPWCLYSSPSNLKSEWSSVYRPQQSFALSLPHSFSLSVPGGTPACKLATGTHTHSYACAHFYTPSPGWPCIDDPSRCLQSCRKLHTCPTISLTIAARCSWNTALMKCRREPCFRHPLLWERDEEVLLISQLGSFWWMSLDTVIVRGVCERVHAREIAEYRISAG